MQVPFTNDTGLTGGHQAGIYVSKPSASVIFNEPGVKGENKDKWVKIKWQNDFATDTRFVYYGKGTRNEYRITNFGKRFELLNAEYTGALLVITKDNDEEYQGFVLNSEAEINHFLNAFGMSPADKNRIILMSGIDSETVERAAIYDFISKLDVDFPSSALMSESARKIQNEVYDHLEYIISSPDKKFIDWINMEFLLFKAVEQLRYGSRIKKGFDSIDEFTLLASQVIYMDVHDKKTRSYRFNSKYRLISNQIYQRDCIQKRGNSNGTNIKVTRKGKISVKPNQTYNNTVSPLFSI